MSQNIFACGTFLKVSCSKAAHQFTSNGETSAQRRAEDPLEGGKTQTHMMETSKNKTKHKHAHKGTQHSTNKTKLNTITLQA
jgi:hypothetical protein